MTITIQVGQMGEIRLDGDGTAVRLRVQEKPGSQPMTEIFLTTKEARALRAALETFRRVRVI